ncbi:hypothetical protein P691DRAFT_784860 [Macrolepiota fuliginosa MF-IS2]|uniref:Uncharacterized protein n=1 Tax=Macrolepiota fuliginosa MF-IS2 TaxID=1400762 RepID=A0A9P6C1J1_9AGAR|nr:hypothetical protein P691DRAFT_784860 [Macrolepiota fuliginosa MF-IS2]
MRLLKESSLLLLEATYFTFWEVISYAPVWTTWAMSFYDDGENVPKLVASENARNLYKLVDTRSTPNASPPPPVQYILSAKATIITSSITLSPPPGLGITMTPLTAPRSGRSKGTSHGAGDKLFLHVS